MDDSLCLFRRQLILLNRLNYLVNTSCTLLLGVVDNLALWDSMETAHDCCLDKTDWAIYIMVFDTGDQDLLAFLEQVLLDSPNMQDVANVLVELWVNGHVLSSHGKSLTVFVLVLDVEHERNTRWILGHHFFQEAHSEMHSFDNQWFIPLVKRVDDLGQFFVHQWALSLIAFERDPTLRCIMPFLGWHYIACLIRGAK